MKSIRFLAAARSELLAEVLHYNELGAGLGTMFARAFEQALAMALQFALAGTIENGVAVIRMLRRKRFVNKSTRSRFLTLTFPRNWNRPLADRCCAKNLV